MKDLFSAVAREYATFRPSYPAVLFERLSEIAPARGTAWDCATGSGQAAVGLAAHFRRVLASDGSMGQLASARRHPRVSYVHARAEAAPIATGSIDLVTVAQALHWLDIEAFWSETRRVLVRGGAVAICGYVLCRISPEIDPIVDRFYSGTVGPFWTPERRIVEEGYRGVPFPFAELSLTAPDMIARLTLDEFLGYVGTWSATQRYREARGSDPLPSLRASLAPLWIEADRPPDASRDMPAGGGALPHGAPDAPPARGGARREVRWPLSVRVGRV
jgi:hypothetical protein